MRLKVLTRRGRFNLCSKEESYSTHIQVLVNEERKLSCNCHPEYNFDSTNVDDVINLIEEEKKNTWYSSEQKDWDAMLEFLREHEAELNRGNLEYRIQKLKKEIE